jgi:hypothetical protein
VPAPAIEPEAVASRTGVKMGPSTPTYPFVSNHVRGPADAGRGIGGGEASSGPPASGDQYESSETISPPARVTRAAKTRIETVSFTNRAEPSPIRMFAPPGWKAKTSEVPSVP